jgi:hypothetical protein
MGDAFLLVVGTGCIEEGGSFHDALILCRLGKSAKNENHGLKLSGLTLP